MRSNNWRGAGAVSRSVLPAVVLVMALGLVAYGGPSGRTVRPHNHVEAVPLAATLPQAPTLSRTGWTATATSAESAAGATPASNVLDGRTTTIWHSAWSSGTPSLPQSITLDMKAARQVSELVYTPRQDKGVNGTIGQYEVSLSTDGKSWGEPVSTGTWADDRTDKSAAFALATARYVRLTVSTEAGGRGPWASAAELNVLGAPTAVEAAAVVGLPKPTGGKAPTNVVNLSRKNWTATASSSETATENDRPANVLDGSGATFWHTRFSVKPDNTFPHTLTIDTHASSWIAGYRYLPRVDDRNGHIGRYQITLSNDGKRWTAPVASGTWHDNNVEHTVTFKPYRARYVRLIASSEAGSRGNFSSAAEINLLRPAGRDTSDPSKVGRWGKMIGFPLVPVAAALLPNNKMLVWSAQWENKFEGGTGKTETAILNLATGAVSEKLVSNTKHDMFCPGVAILPDGRIMVTGGDDSKATSIYNPATNTWATGPKMNIGRGYQGQTLLQNGEVFTIGGSWIDNDDNDKVGEVWSAKSGWRTLPGVSSDPTMTADTGGRYRADNHDWLFPVTGGRLLQAGPSKAMNWITTAGNGTITSAGTRGDADAMNGNAVMYDTDKILAVGGSPDYENMAGTTKAYTINASGATPRVAETGSMSYARTLNNSVVLPDGSVLTLGGQSPGVLFSDAKSVLAGELWNPRTGEFTLMSAQSRGRNYHSVAILLPNGRVFSGGGGLCGDCTTNHADGQIFSPPYLLNADGSYRARPVLSGTPKKAAAGATITVRTSSKVTSFALVRYGEATHSVNNDQRRISLKISKASGNTYALRIPSDKGAVLPGPYMLFAMNSRGTPSVAQTIYVS